MFEDRVKSRVTEILPNTKRTKELREKKEKELRKKREEEDKKKAEQQQQEMQILKLKEEKKR
jgi:hypothetical protein